MNILFKPIVRESIYVISVKMGYLLIIEIVLKVI